ncbi:MAG TPA: tetratricopeptide repeat protein [Anaeromyxobacteraceae bacterium]|nr:tetratricopeptide repeat protein [Anaeromyxobacteraceae bacterium]
MDEKSRKIAGDPAHAADGLPPGERRDPSTPPLPLLSFEGFTLDLARRLLRRGPDEIRLRPQTFDVLGVLAQAPNRVVKKEALFASVWGSVSVTDDSLVQCIHELRVALGDPAQRLIRTVPRRGYLLAAEVTTCERPPARGADGPRVARRWAAPATAVAIAAATLTAVAAWRALHVPGPGPERLGSLAVLPFRPLAAAAEDDAILGLGIADALILKLSAVTRLVVRPTSAVVRIAPGDEARASGRRLGVDYVLEGHLQRSGQALRVTAQLLEVETGAALWNDRFEVEASDVFRVQDAIAERAAASLLRSLSRDERKLLARRDTAIPEARLAYVRGRYLWSRRTESALEAGVVQFQRALDLDPRYALAASGLADAYNLLGAYGSRVPRASFERAMAAARSALEIDETVAEAHASLAFAIAHHDHDWERAEREYRRALELAPGYATALQWLALCFAAQGRFDDAIATSRRAAEADPLSPIIATDVGRHLYYARRYPAAIEQLRAAVELDPTFARAHQELGRAYRQQGLADLAVAELTRAVALSDRASAPLAELASARAAVGDARGARAIAVELERRAQAGTYVSRYHFAVIAAALGDAERAVAGLRAAYEDRFNWIVFVAVEPQFDGLRSAPEFQKIVAQLRRGGSPRARP